MEIQKYRGLPVFTVCDPFSPNRKTPMSIEQQVPDHGDPERALNSAIRQLRQRMERNNVLQDVNDRRYHQKPSERKRESKKRARWSQKMRDLREQ